MPKRGYVTVLFGFDYRSNEQEAEFREAIHGDAEDTAQRYGFINHWETHDENMLAEEVPIETWEKP
jgi:hypothetical protein